MEIVVNTGSAPPPHDRLRIIPKPSRYFRTRYWVVLPRAGTGGERWLLVPSVGKAMEHISRWLLAKADRQFNVAAQQCGSLDTLNISAGAASLRDAATPRQKSVKKQQTPK